MLIHKTKPNAFDTARDYQFLSYTRQSNTKAESLEHSHSYSEIYFITEGKGYFCTRNERWKIQRGSVIINNPDVKHWITPSESEPLEYAVFAIANISFSANEDLANLLPAETLSSSEENQKRQTFPFDFSKHYETLFDILRVIEWEHDKKTPFWSLAFLVEIDKMLLFLFRNTTLENTPHLPQQKPNSMNDLRLYINASYSDEITLESLSNRFFLNKFYLVHAFKKKYGISPIAYLNQVRCKEAQSLLEHSDLSVAEIAISVGFNSISHFSETYKKYYGVSPSATRKTPPPSENKKEI